MNTLVQIAAVAVTAVLMTGVVRRAAPEFSVLLVLAAGLWMLAAVIRALEDVVDMLSRLVRIAQLEGQVVEPVLKTVALSILTRVTGEVCRGAGEGGIAAFVEVAGAVLALGAAVPLCDDVVQLIAGLLV